MCIPVCRRPKRRVLSGLAAAVAAIPGVVRAVTYTSADAFDLNPALAGFTQSVAEDGLGGQQVGYIAASGTNPVSSAVVWSSTAGSAVNLTPSGSGYSSGVAFATNGSIQVGYASGSDTSNESHAIIWLGGGYSLVDLNPSGYQASFAFAISGNQQVGGGDPPNSGGHALLWNGTAASAVDLAPTNIAGIGSSSAVATDGIHQAGYALGPGTGNNLHAMLWAGSASSAVDLNPTNLPGISSSSLSGVNGTQEVGGGSGPGTGNYTHGFLWTGTANSAVDLTPPGANASGVTATNGSRQVGYVDVNGTNSVFYAAVWAGTGASVVNLGALLPNTVTSSQARSIDAYGNVFGSATVGGLNHATEWLAGDTFNLSSIPAATGTADWNSPSHWLSGIPSTGNDAMLISSDAGSRIVTFDAASSSVNNLIIDGTGSGGSMTLGQTQGTLNGTVESIGFIGTGFYAQTGGINNAISLTLGVQNGSTGNYFLAGGTLYASQFALNSGQFNQSGGTAVIFQFAQTGGTYSNSGTLTIGSGTGAIGTYQFTGGAMVVPAVYVQSGGTLSATTLTLSATATGSINQSGGTISAGTINLQRFGSLISTGGSLVFSSLNQTGGTISGGTLTIPPNATYTYTAGSVSSALVNNGSILLNGNFTTSSSSITNNGIITIPTGVTAAFNTSTWTNNGLINLTGGTLAGYTTGAVPVNYATIIGYGIITTAFSNYGSITESGGSLSFPQGVSNNGALNLTTGFASSSAGTTNDGTIYLNGGTFSSVTLQNNPDGAIIGPGTITGVLYNGFLGPLSRVYPGGSIVDGAGTLTLPTSTNYGTIQLAGATAVLASPGTITNSGSLEGFGQVAATINNKGTIESTGGVLAFTGSVTNAVTGTIRADLGTKVLMQSVFGFQTNSGLINLAGGTFDDGGQYLTNSGQITGYGVFSSGTVENAGTLILTGGTSIVNGAVVNDAGYTINVKYQPALFTGAVTNNGTIKATNTTLTFTGSYSGTNYISDPSTNVFQANVTVVTGGQMTGGSGDQYYMSGGTFTNQGTFSNAGLLESSDVTVNSGYFNQSGTQVWSAGAIFTNAAGTAVFGTDTGSASAETLSVNVSGGTVIFGSIQHLVSLNIGAGSSAQLTGGGNGHRSTLFTPAFADTGTLDLAGNDLDVQAGGAAALKIITALIGGGYNNGKWTGAGITSSSAASDFSHLTAVGVILNATAGNKPLYMTLDGAAVALNDVLAKLTYYGDANLDGKVDGSDYSLIDSAYLADKSHPGSYTGWYNGDFNYDGVVDGSDYTLLDNGFNTQGVNLNSTVAVPTATIAATSAVPEPGLISLLCMGGITSLGRRRRRRLMAIALAAPLLLAERRAMADKYYVNAGNSDWNNPVNWSSANGGTGGAGVPGSGDNVFITAVLGGGRTVNYDDTADTIASLDIDYLGGGATNTLVFPSSPSYQLTANGVEYVGNVGNGAITQNGGLNNFYSGLYLAYSNGSSGTYSLNTGGTLTANQFENIGNSGIGTFNQTGGTHTIVSGQSLFMGFQSNAVGTYYLGGSGTFSVGGNEAIGWFGTGTFNQISGTHTLNGSTSILYLGYNSHSVGNYLLSGGTLLAGPTTLGNSTSEVVGYSGVGNFNQSAGVHTVDGSLTLASGSTSNGTYILSGGSLTTGIDGNDTFNEIVGNSGIGTFNQTGGTHTVGSTANGYSENLTIANNSSSIGTYLLSGPASTTLTVTGNEFIGEEGSGNFIQTGGAHIVDMAVSIADFSGRSFYILKAGAFQTPFLVVGGDEGGGGQGVFNQSGGTSNISGQVWVGGGAPSAGTFVISGGTATIGGDMKIGGGEIDQEGDSGTGTVTVSGSGVLTVPSNITVFNAGGNQLNLMGGTINAGNLVLGGGLSQFNWTSGTLHLTNAAINIQTNGFFGPALTLSYGMTLIPDGGLNIAPGATLTIAGGSLNISAGCTTSNQGMLNQTSGNVAISGLFENSGTARFGGTLTWGPASVYVNLAGTTTLGQPFNSSGFGPVVVVTGGSLIIPPTQAVPSLTIGAGTSADVASTGSGHALVTSALTFAGTTNRWSGQLDLTQNDLIVHNGILSQLTNQAAQGYNNGKWTGAGITSSSAANDPAHLTAVGVILNTTAGSTPLYTTFDGAAVAINDVLVKVTYYGDANLDGKVDGSDYSLIDYAYLADKSHPGSYTGWYNGDFNYDGAVNGSDYSLLDNAFNAQSANLDSVVVLPTEAVATSNAVPEPGIAVDVVAIVGLLSIRRSRGRRIGC